jgi:hypothetical protein
MNRVKGLVFKKCFELSQQFKDGGLTVNVLHLNHLLHAKKQAGRFKDLDDIEQLSKRKLH